MVSKDRVSRILNRIHTRDDATSDTMQHDVHGDSGYHDHSQNKSDSEGIEAILYLSGHANPKTFRARVSQQETELKIAAIIAQMTHLRS